MCCCYNKKCVVERKELGQSVVNALHILLNHEGNLQRIPDVGSKSELQRR